MMTETPKKPIPGMSIILSILMTGMYLMIPMQFMISGSQADESMTLVYLVLAVASWCCTGLQKGLAQPALRKQMAPAKLIVMAVILMLILASMMGYIAWAPESITQSILMIASMPALIILSYMIGFDLHFYTKTSESFYS